MTIVQLEYLLAVANSGGFSSAAERCFVTQPTLSAQIRQLEDELGVVLFDRGRQPVVVTQQGEVVVEQARRAVAEFYRIKEALDEVRNLVAGRLVVGIIPTVAPWLLPRFVPAFRAQHPDVELIIKELRASEIVDTLSHDELDCAVMAAGTAPADYDEQELFDDRFFAYVSPRHRLSERSNVRVEDVEMEELLVLGKGHCLRDQVLELFAERRGEPMSIEGSVETLMRLVDEMSAVTVIPEMAVRYVPAGRLEQVKTLLRGAVGRKIVLVTRRNYVKASIIDALKASINGQWSMVNDQ